MQPAVDPGWRDMTAGGVRASCGHHPGGGPCNDKVNGISPGFPFYLLLHMVRGAAMVPLGWPNARAWSQRRHVLKYGIRHGYLGLRSVIYVVLAKVSHSRK